MIDSIYGKKEKIPLTNVNGLKMYRVKMNTFVEVEYRAGSGRYKSFVIFNPSMVSGQPNAAEMIQLAVENLGTLR